MGPGTSHPVEAATTRWLVLGRVLASSLHIWLFFWLLLAVVVPAVLFGWEPLVISSGSMEPLIRPGDVVLAEPAPSGGIAPGDVITYEDPSRGGSLVSHRVMSIEREGWFRTQGDANRSADSIPVAAGSVLGRGRLLVPFVGLPALWLRENPLLLAAWIAATVIAGHVLVGPSSPFSAPPAKAREDRSPRALPVVVSSILVVAFVLVTATSDHSAAAFTAATDSTGQSFAAGTFCATGSQTVTASGASTVVENKPTVNFSGDTELVVRSALQTNARVLLEFPLPTIPTGCSLTGATLTLTAGFEEAGRTYELVRADAPFDIVQVTWDTQPSATGTVSATVTDGVLGATEFDATAPVTELYADGNNGLVLRDADERYEAAGSGGGRVDPGRSESTYDSDEVPSGVPTLTVSWTP